MLYISTYHHDRSVDLVLLSRRNMLVRTTPILLLLRALLTDCFACLWNLARSLCRRQAVTSDQLPGIGDSEHVIVLGGFFNNTYVIFLKWSIVHHTFEIYSSNSYYIHAILFLKKGTTGTLGMSKVPLFGQRPILVLLTCCVPIQHKRTSPAVSLPTMVSVSSRLYHITLFCHIVAKNSNFVPTAEIGL